MLFFENIARFFAINKCFPMIIKNTHHLFDDKKKIKIRILKKKKNIFFLFYIIILLPCIFYFSSLIPAQYIIPYFGVYFILILVIPIINKMNLKKKIILIL
jgi:hypothetical protein